MATVVFAAGVTALVAACSDDAAGGAALNPPPPTSTGYRVAGQITRAGAPLPGVRVSVDDVLNWSTVTDAAGRFAIADVSAGGHNISLAETSDDGSFSERRSVLQVTGDLDLTALQLPRPLTLAPPTASGTKVTITWPATDALDFREYKLYRRDSPGLDEKAGDLVFVSTVRGETTFVDERLLAGKTYYYRVYLMNDLGRLGGSNIVSLKVTVDNLIPDGDFESETALSHWEVVTDFNNGTATLDRRVGHGGSGSLHMTSFGGVKLIEGITLQKDVTYELSYFLKLLGKRNNIDDAWIGIYQGSTVVASFTIPPTVGPRLDAAPDGWTTQQKSTFSLASEGAVTIHITSYTDDLWLDDLVLKPRL